MSKITIIGLGSSELDQMPLGIFKRLKEESFVYTRTMDHPVIEELKALGVSFKSFDNVYTSQSTFEDTYSEIVKTLIHQLSSGDVVYTVPGHPMFYETTTALLIEQSKLEGFVVEVIGGQSFIDAVITATGMPINEHFQMLDATIMQVADFDYKKDTLITQVYDAYSLSDAKITLLDYYPPETAVQLIDAAGSKSEKVYHVELHELDHENIESNLLTIYIPKQNMDALINRDIYKMVEHFDVLVSEDGCPWDKVQTHQSIERYLIEEAYELIEAIENEDDDGIIEELADILLQVALHSAIAKKNGYFDFFDVLESMNQKVVRRHPHVFGDEIVESMDDLNQVWTKAKKEEGKGQRPKREKEFGEYVLKWMHESIHEEKTLQEVLKEGRDNDEIR